MGESFYDILGVSESASDGVIRAAFKARQRETHPDMPGGSQTESQKVTEAYEILRDPERRAEYDRELNQRRRAEHRRAEPEATATPDSAPDPVTETVSLPRPTIEKRPFPFWKRILWWTAIAAMGGVWLFITFTFRDVVEAREQLAWVWWKEDLFHEGRQAASWAYFYCWILWVPLAFIPWSLSWYVMIPFILNVAIALLSQVTGLWWFAWSTGEPDMLWFVQWMLALVIASAAAVRFVLFPWRARQRWGRNRDALESAKRWAEAVEQETREGRSIILILENTATLTKIRDLLTGEERYERVWYGSADNAPAGTVMSVIYRHDGASEVNRMNGVELDRWIEWSEAVSA